tara:strand:- start:817 stop:1902 length:1086 start_codon:yes stop_codon:yes gene_type:complete
MIFIGNKFLIKNYDEKDNFYRAHERFITDDFIYKKNVNFKTNIPHGDIVALNYCDKSRNISQPREQTFLTDENGFRNNKFKIEEADIILVGDSFITGSSNSQEDIPANILSNLSGLKVYTISVIHGPELFEKNLEDMINKINKKAKIFVFYTEGTDFKLDYINDDKSVIYWNGVKITYLKYKIRFGYERLERNKDKIFIKKFKNLYEKNYFYKKIRPKSQRLTRYILAKWTNTCPIEYKNIKGLELGFYYKPAQSNMNVNAYIFKNKEILERINKIIYIPTKYSVYGPLIDEKYVFFSGMYDLLKNEYGKYDIDTINLTSVLQKSAQMNLKNDKLIFWQDDTHWNKLGIKSAMQALISEIN